MKILTVVGARPQFVKAAAVSRAVNMHNSDAPENRIEEFLLHTGQHYDDLMSGIFFRDLDLPEPNQHLGVGSGPQGWQTAGMLAGIEESLLRERPDWVVVYGDTNSTLAGALAAVKLHIPVAHVEAGLRSYNRRMAEEHNRVVSDHLSALLFCPTGTAVENLRREGIDGLGWALVADVGDVMYDSILHYAGVAEGRSHVLEELRLGPREYGLATIHRAENTDDPARLESIFRGLEELAGGGLTIVLPLHPRTRKVLEAHSLQTCHSSLLLIDPVSYLDMLLLEKNAKVVLTDSGGVQKEAYWFRVPCVTMRDDSEWVETLDSGWNVLVGADPEKIVAAAHAARPGMDGGHFYGDGHAAERIVKTLLNASHAKTPRRQRGVYTLRLHSIGP